MLTRCAILAATALRTSGCEGDFCKKTAGALTEMLCGLPMMPEWVEGRGLPNNCEDQRCKSRNCTGVVTFFYRVPVPWTCGMHCVNVEFNKRALLDALRPYNVMS